MIDVLVPVILVAAGYLLGRVRPVRHAFEWAHWGRYDRHPTVFRRVIVWMLLSSENTGLLILHPRRVWRYLRSNSPDR